MFENALKAGEIITNRQLMDIFHCACEGGIRYSRKTRTIVLVVNTTKQGLPNIWHDGILEFAGRPMKKDTGLTGANRRLEEFLNANGDIFLFIVKLPGKYEFLGRARAAGPMHLAESGENIRYPVFPLQIV